MSFLPGIKCGKNSSRDPVPNETFLDSRFHGNDKNVSRKFSDLGCKNLRLVRNFAWKRGPLRGSLQMTFINLPLWRLCRNVILRLLPKLVLSGAKEPMRSFTTFRMMP